MKGMFVVNLSKNSTHWHKGSVRMECVAEFAMGMEQSDEFLTMDVEKGYRHMRLHPKVRDWLLSLYACRYYQCVALLFGWSLSALWFTQFMALFVKVLRGWGFRVLAYIDDFLMAPSSGRASTRAYFNRADPLIEGLMAILGIRRQTGMVEWIGSSVVDHLSVRVDSGRMIFAETADKNGKARKLSHRFLKEVRTGRRRVSTDSARSFCGICVSLTLSMPWARFYTRTLYSDVSGRGTSDVRGRSRFSLQSVRYLRFWRQLSSPSCDVIFELPVRTHPVEAAMHTDSADMGYGGTLSTTDMTAGAPGMWVYQGAWAWQDRSDHITLRELRTITSLLIGHLGRRL